jgi:hypothetical protein
VPVRERVSGTDHPDTLAARGSLAYWTGEAGDAAGAAAQLKALIQVRGRVSGSEHPATLTIRHNVAYWTGVARNAAVSTRLHLAHWTATAGNPAAAREQLTALLPVLERVRGPGHRDTRDARSELAALEDTLLDGP